ncbi:MAG: vWA domain-containing protein [Hasllibacter sp.]
MLLPFFSALRAERAGTTLREWLDFLAALKAGEGQMDVDAFYWLARAALVKDETRIDRFDRAFAKAFEGLADIPVDEVVRALDLPEDWLRKLAEKDLTEDEKAQVEAMGGFDKLMETLRQRLEEQKGRHQGGSKWVGTAGTSPFGAYGYNPEGVRIGQHESRHRRAVKVWDRREFRDLDDTREIGTRAIKLALKRLRRWARDGAAEELDLPATIRESARQGYIDVRTRPERRNAVKVLLLLDVGGSMDDHVKQAEELFSAARAEFAHLEHFYFHNCPYDFLWKQNRRRREDQIRTWDVLNTYGPDWTCIVVGDAAMSPYEIAFRGGANEYWNEEAGETWLRRLSGQWPRLLWINPVPEEGWRWTQSTRMIQEIVGEDRMVPLTLEGLTRGMRLLT